MVATLLCDASEYKPIIKGFGNSKSFRFNEKTWKYEHKLNADEFYSILTKLKPNIVHLHTLPNDELYNALKMYKKKKNGKIFFTPHSLVIHDIVSDLVMHDYHDPFIKELREELNNGASVLDALKVLNKKYLGNLRANIRTFVKKVEENEKMQFPFLYAQEKMFKLADKIIAVSEFEKQAIEFFYPEYARKVVKIENASDFTELLKKPEFLKKIKDGVKELEKRLFFKRNHDIAFAYVGRFADEKGVGTLIEAMQYHLPKYKNTRFYFIVPTSQHNLAYDTLTQHLGNYQSRFLLVAGDDTDAVSRLLNTPKFYDYNNREMVATWIAFSDYLIVPSKRESFGLTALEGALIGTPLIISNADALPEMHPYASQFAPPDDAKALSKLLDLLTKEHPKQHAFLKGYMAEHVREFNYFNKYSPKNFVKKHLQLYSKYF